MEYTVYRDPGALNSTAYMEIEPGKYRGQHWQQGFLFVSEEAFSLVEGIMLKHFPTYDHYDTNDIPRESGLVIANELRTAAIALGSCTAAEAAHILFVPARLKDEFQSGLETERTHLQAMLAGIADELDRSYLQEDYACVLGM